VCAKKHTEIVLTFGVFFGAHPAVSYILREKKVNNVISLVIKTVWFVGSILLIYTLFSAFLFEESLLNNEVFKKYAYLILSIVGALLFVVYDLLIARFQTMLDRTIDKLKL
jgi:fluoride ion exporter CrcB/FEX